MENFERLFGKFYKYVCFIIIAMMVLIVFVNTVLRYCFNSGLVENEEVLRYLFIWATFLGIIAVYYDHQHIAVTMFVDKLSPRIANVFSFFANFLVLFAFYVLVDGSIEYMAESRTTVGQMTNLPFVYIIVSAVFAGIACFGIVAIDMIKQFRRMFGYVDEVK